jgi:GYF domain 2
MDDDSRVIDRGWDALPEYGSTSGDADDAVTVSISTTPGEWLVNTVDAVVVPMSMAEVVEALQQHKLTDRSLVWRAGMQEWAPVDKVPQLKLAARMSPVKAASPSAPPRPAPAALPTPSKPPSKPVRATPPPGAGAPASVPPQSIPSRKATLPFGPTAPPATQSRPAGSRPSQPSQARVALPPAASKEEPEVLAVYDRPAATISFDLSPVQPLRTAPPSAPAPQTLAPTTTDSAQRRAPAPRNADLSVVAASDFRQVQRSSKRLVLLSSLASAAAASLVTFALSRGHTANTAAATPVVVAPPAAAPVAAAAPVEPTPTPSAVPSPAPTPAEVAAPAPVVEKPKPSARKARAVSAPPRPRPEAVVPAATRDPASEPNPYDVKLEEEEPSAKPAPAPASTHGSGLEADNDAPQVSSSSNTSPGF